MSLEVSLIIAKYVKRLNNSIDQCWECGSAKLNRALTFNERIQKLF
jgi:hypothetical protein